MSPSCSQFHVLSINHENVPLDIRERYSVDAGKVGLLYDSLEKADFVTESLILSTCNRFELYACVGPDCEDKLFTTLESFYDLKVTEIKEHARIRSGKDAVRHLIEVAAGLRSQITGEAEIFGQVKAAYSRSTSTGSAGKVINRIFQKGFQAAKLIRHTTQIGEGQINISNVAVDLSSKIFGNLKGTSALVLGTGEIGEKTVKALKSRGVARFGIASRTIERAKEVAEDWGATALSMEDVNDYLNDYDIVLASTVVDEPIITYKSTQAALGKRKGRPLFLIDLGLPRNIDPNCQNFDNVFLYNLDDLAAIAEENQAQRKKAVLDSEEIAVQKSDIIWGNLVSRGQVK